MTSSRTSGQGTLAIEQPPGVAVEIDRLPGLRARLRRLPKLATLVVLVTMVVAIFADRLVLHDPESIDPARGQLPPALLEDGRWEHPLGTDRKGRDIFSRVVLGTRISLAVAVTAILAGGLVGTSLGFVAGYRGGLVEAVIMRATDAFLAFPGILVALVLTVTVGPSFQVVVAVLALILWPRYSRQVRGEVLYWTAQEFVLGARALGAPGHYIVLRHILPNVVNTIVVLCTLQMGWAIVVEASLSYLGAGIPPPTPSWGSMVAEGQNFVETAWWISVFPGVSIMLVVLSLNLLGDWLRDLLDPKLRNV
jgi:peptide/nickel transport system permease protein